MPLLAHKQISCSEKIERYVTIIFPMVSSYLDCTSISLYVFKALGF